MSAHKLMDINMLLKSICISLHGINVQTMVINSTEPHFNKRTSNWLTDKIQSWQHLFMYQQIREIMKCSQHNQDAHRRQNKKNVSVG